MLAFAEWWMRYNPLGKLEGLVPIIGPNTRRKLAWDIFIMCLVLYNAVMVPLAFSYGVPDHLGFTLVEYVLTAFYAVDMAVSFRTAYYDDDGNMVRDSWPVARRYLTTWFMVDFFATVPFDAIGQAAGLGGSQTQLTVLAIFKTPRLLRLIKLVRLLDRLRRANAIKVVQLILLMVMIAHWLACIWYIIARYTPREELWGFDTLHDHRKLTWYLSAFYYSFLMLLGDKRDAYNNYERLFYIICLVAGACFYSAVVGNMALLVANMNIVSVRYRMLPTPQGCEPAFIRTLATRMRIVTFIPREVIFRQGDLGQEMYIIRSGCVAVLSKTNEYMSLLKSGDFFGEIALLTQARRTAKCIALSNCDLAVLNSYDLKLLMKEFPESASTLQAAARERLRQLQIAGRAGTAADDEEDEGKRREREELRRTRIRTISRFATGEATLAQ
ncbi:hypothetical protein GPECTOR_17g909 [Gonium pectorale]|uniref:Cyclic nucleotide-binding domain-containing protein n=1 Tax=Gonium pectorale TaxID=33097 RepID=A0A150GLS9_GONPE|nr:hypothetical protein GPECTOR_17g909 [Gonium pectorale]|eukprot:KXZ50270.1 hypothetical protein GPECTOR_17g909 [Gonium pectorale]